MKTKEITNQVKYSLAFIALFLFIGAAIHPATAENKVTIATIGASPNINKNQAPEKLVEQMVDFWRGQLRQVLRSKVDLIVLPEVCDAPGGLKGAEQENYLKVRQNQLLNYFASVAKDNNCYIAFGSIHETKEGLRNSLILLDRKGKIAGTYNKNFPTIYEMDAGIIPGNEVSVIQCDFGKVALAICFDLNFDELRQQYAKAKPDIVIFSSVYHGGLMQGAWAYSCRSYFVSAIGDTRLPSEILNPLGEVVATSTNYFNYTKATINLDYKIVHLDYNWDKLTKLKAKYGDAVIIHDPGKIGSVMITSEDKNISAEQMIKEFDIELLDDYFNRSRVARNKDKYNFAKEKIINDLGEFNISITDGVIIFDSAYGKIDAPLHYKRDINSFNFDGAYKIVNNRNQSYYFRFGWVTFKDHQTIFSNVKWLKEDLPESGKYKILTIDLKLEQHGSISLCTIGDSQTWWNAANNLRLELNNNFPDLLFVGSRTDVNGYPHEGEGGNNTNQVLSRISYVPRADYYTLLLGTNDWRSNIDSAFKNINDICSILLKKYPQSKILYITPLPTTNTIRDQFNTKLKGILIKSFTTNKRIEVVDVGGKMRENPDWSTAYLLKDGLHQNTIGTKFMAGIIANKIKF